MNAIKAMAIAAVFVSFSVPALSQDPRGRRPDIILIVTDDQGHHDVSRYGTPDLQTPHIDGIAAKGISLDRFYSNSSVCSPTRAALLSGKYPDRVGVPGVIRTHPENNWGYLKAGTRLLPAILSANGYHTGLVGKWHLGLESPNTPTEQGFDYFKGWLGDMMDDYWEHKRHGINYMRHNTEIINPEGHATDLFTDWAIDFIRENHKKEKPFFLCLTYNAPHTPVQPPEEWLRKVKARHPGLPEKRAEFVALIEHLDDGIGKVLEALEEQQADRNTLVIFTSDNGGYLPSLANNGPVRNGKGSMYEGGLLVPAFVSWPGHIPAGSRSSRAAISMDLSPTILEIAGIQPGAYGFDGVSILPELLSPGKGKEEARTLYFTRREGGPQFGGESIYALRKGKWKLVKNTPYSPLELYDLESDPKEEKELRDQFPEVFRSLQKELMIHIQEGGQSPWQKE